MKDSGAKVIVTLDVLFPRVTKVKGNTELQHIIVTAIKDFLPFPKNLLYPFVQKKQYGLVVNVKHEGTHHLLLEILKQPKRLLNPFDVLMKILLCSNIQVGQQGLPKGVMFTHRNLIANATMCSAWLYKCKRGEEIMLGVIPFFHVYGVTTVMILSVMQAYKMILLPKFDVETTLKTIHKERPTLFPGAPTIYIGILKLS